MKKKVCLLLLGVLLILSFSSCGVASNYIVTGYLKTADNGDSLYIESRFSNVYEIDLQNKTFSIVALMSILFASSSFSAILKTSRLVIITITFLVYLSFRYSKISSALSAILYISVCLYLLILGSEKKDFPSH